MKILELKKTIEKVLNNNKANNIITIDLRKKSYIADYMIIASGTSSKHIQSLSELIVSELKRNGIDNCRIEGKESNDWKLVDTKDIIVISLIQREENFMILKKCGLKTYQKKRQ